MKSLNATADFFIPDGKTEDEALKRVTHLGVGAHPDDLELLAGHAILECQKKGDGSFAGVVCADGAGCPRSGPFARNSEDEMKEIRRQEQRAAAALAGYGLLVQLGYRSRDVRDGKNPALEQDLLVLLEATRPHVVYCHDLADRHDTHVAVSAALIRAIRWLKPEDRPQKLFGCEVWRGLDWLDDKEKVIFDLAGADPLLAEALREHKSQLQGGRRFDAAFIGRLRANAAFQKPLTTGPEKLALLAMDLTPLIRDPGLDLADFVAERIGRFQADVCSRIRKVQSF